ncbi:MAG: trypsin-like peptidase domain-containing protein [Allosphingosinicella sp.]|uniref:trypsin-like peptidase domain-containing protein n=1 Tax=Allosphingosinicella sp. TaxID=2823234 RepID=UPI0039644FB4
MKQPRFGNGRQTSGRSNILLLLLLVLVSAIAGAALFSLWRGGEPAARAAPIAVRPPDQATLAPLVERAGPAVVNIAVVQASPAEQNPLLRDPWYRRFFGVPEGALRPRLSAGSGVIVDARRGLVITNHHVVQEARAIEVMLTDRRRFQAQLLGSDPATDIAVLRIPSDNLSELPLGDSDQLDVGDYVVAIGNPFGLGQTVTAGIVSALGRGLSAEGYENYVQTDAPINPGNSGGPLIGLNGEIVGINSALFGPGGANVGIGFAVPSNIARYVMEQVLRHGEVRRGRIGVALSDIVPGENQPRGAPAEGVLIAGIEQGSPAAAAGLQPGDVIVAAGGRGTATASELRNAIGMTEVGRRLPLRYVRGGREAETEVEVRPGPEADRRPALRLVR